VKPWLLKSLLVITVFSIAWVAALYYWQTSHRVPNGIDIGIYFFAIPLGVLLTIWLGAKSWKAIKNRASSSSSETSDTESSHIKVDEKEPLFATILSSAVYMQHGKSSEELLSAIKDNDLEVNLDSELVNEEGFPILSVRISDLDEDSQRNLLSEWEEDNKRVAVSWIGIVKELGWPQEKLTIRLYPQTHFSQAPKLIEKIMADSAEPSLPFFNLIVSANSFIDEVAIDSWSSQLIDMFGAKHNPASIPGEGAAGLLVADAVTAALFDSLLKTTIYQPWFVEMDVNQHISDTERKKILEELITYALEKSRLTAEKIKFVSSDTASYTKTLVELFTVGSDTFPELDAGEDYFSSSNQCGIIGTSASLLALAIAHEAVKQEDEAALFISHMDQTMRAVAVIDKYKQVELPEDVETSDDNPSQS